jgi:type IV pilus assembly protein PilN
MRNDLNFFSAYQGRKRERKDDKKIIYAIGAVLGTFIVASLLWNSINLYIVGESVKEYKTMLADTNFLNKLSETEKAENKLKQLSVYTTSLASLQSAIDSRTAVSSKVLNALSSTLPSEVSFYDISVDKEEITIKAVSTRRAAIGELEFNLNQLEMVQDVHVGKIDDKDLNFTCEIKCALKDVVKNED